MRVLALALLLVSGHAKVTHTEPPLPEGWAYGIVPLPGVSFQLSVKQAGFDELRKIARRVSDPSDTMYGQYLTKAQIDAVAAPAASDVATVMTWAASTGCAAEAVGEMISVSCARQDAAEALLETTCRPVWNSGTKQRAVRCSDFALPEAVHEAVQALYGLHGLPLPPRVAPSRLRRGDLLEEAAKVTPAVLASTYKISGVTPTGSTKNRNAVAEFQGQTMASKDLQTFCNKFLPGAKASDCAVHKFVGDKGEGSDETEAALDIQYIKGVAPGVLTEFWYFKNTDFCGDLKNWTQLILSSDDAPLVHSVSYGWQGNMTTLTGCKLANVNDVDANFVKLAAKGITIIFASGDSGAGYTPPRQECFPAPGLEADTALVGTVSISTLSRDSSSCCNSAGEAKGVAGWTWTPTKPELCPEQTILKGVALDDYAGEQSKVASQEACCALGLKHNNNMWSYDTTTGMCKTFDQVRGRSVNATSVSGLGAEAAEGHCVLYSAVTGKKASPGASSVTSTGPPKLKFYPSWPASSPWVTSVGGTRFVGQKVGAEEMATDQFGSGGGFSEMFDAFDAQKTDIAHYFTVAPQLPPAGTYPKGGRGTPDVAALGEGYQVVIDGSAQSVGGTSASSPMFAGVVSLLNEARIQKGKPPMGYLNPWIYQNADAFTDIVLGDNARGRGPFAEPYGWNCTKGWDPVTGVGTPLFDKMLAAAMKTSSAIVV